MIEEVCAQQNSRKKRKADKMMSLPGSIAFDEYGRPFIILRDQENQKRLTGNEAIKVRLWGTVIKIKRFFGVSSHGLKIL